MFLVWVLFATSSQEHWPDFGEPGTRSPPELLWAMELVVFTGCSLHDAQIAFKRPLLEWMGDADCVRNVHVAVESIRNSMDLIIRHLGLWITRSLRFGPPLTDDEISDRQCLWTCLGLEPDLVDLMSTTLQFHWGDGQITVTEELRGTDCVGLISIALLSIWRLRQFTDSRWLQTGTTGRALTSAHLTGLPHLVQQILNDPCASKYFLGGFRKLGVKEWAFMAHCAVASRPMDSILLMLMEDPRVLPQLEALKNALCEEMEWMASLPDFVWKVLANVASLPTHEFRHRCLSAGHASVCIFHCRVIVVAEGSPFNLALGCIEDNLSWLSQQPEPSELNAKKIWCLLQDGFGMQLAVRIVSLFLEIPWTTLTAEQLHGIAASLRRHHPDYALGTLLSRSLVLAVHKLLPTASQEERLLDKLYAKEKKFEQKNPDKAAGRQLYLQELHEVARAKVDRRGRPLPPNMAMILMKRHGESYSHLSRADRAQWEHRAHLKATSARENIVSELQGLKAEILLQEERAMAKALERPPIMLRACPWGDQELQLFFAFLKGSDFGQREVSARRAELEEAPDPVAEVKIGTATAGPGEAEDLEPPPAWLHQLCARRSHFAKAAFVWQSHGEQSVAIFMYALQQPSFVGISFLKVSPSEDFGCPDASASASLADLATSRWAWCVEADWGLHASLAKVAPRGADEISVLPNLVHERGRALVSDARLVPLTEYLERFPSETGRQGAHRKQHRESDSTREQLLKDHPWLKETMGLGRVHGDECSPLLPLDRTTWEMEGDEDTALDEIEIEAAFAELEEKRAEDDLLGLAAEDDFKVGLLGGAASQRDRGYRVQSISCWLGTWRL